MNLVLTNRIIFLLAIAGAAVSSYLTLAHLNFVDLGCNKVAGCGEVAIHYTAKGFGIPGLQIIPTAAFGVMMYLALIALSMVRAGTTDVAEVRRISRSQWTIAAIGVAVSAWLTYLEAFVIHAWCQWCLASAFIIVLIFLTTSAERIVGPRAAQGEAA